MKAKPKVLNPSWAKVWLSAPSSDVYSLWLHMFVYLHKLAYR